MAARRALQVVMPTMNAARYLAPILSYYRDVGIDLLVFVDTKSADATREIAARFFPTVDLANDHPFIEPAIETLSRAADADWILRFDDDELPSRAMMAFVARVVAGHERPGVEAYGFARHQCLATADGRLLAHRAHSATGMHRQFRLYRPDRMTYWDELHHAGFYIDECCNRAAPDEAFMVHLDWVVHDRHERRAKVARYAQILPDRSAEDADYYLYEETAVAPDDLVPLDAPEFADVVRRLTACTIL